MSGKEIISPIIRTKLYRPPVTPDILPRERLLKQLTERLHRPLTLVSAPAGYGKTTLVSRWLETCDCPSVWVSLDENDNDLRLFLSYFIAAIHSSFPDAISKTMTLINASTLPPVSALAGSLVNELDLIEQDFILVLDDVHCIQEKSVHDFLSSLLRHPPRPMHLVLVSRRDPLLALPSLRARSQLTEIRLQDLRFTASETGAYLKQIVGKPIDEDTATEWAEKTEGWVTGLRLAALSVRHRKDVHSILRELQGGAQYVTEYLLSEILSHQSAEARGFLLKTSILDRFCASLCDVVCETRVEPGDEQRGSREFIELLKRENLFVISLDAEGQWFRYHHLFQQLLQNQLKRHHSPDEIAALHSLTVTWFESQGLITESIKHAIAGGDVVRAAEIVERYRNDEFNADRWYNVLKWLSMLPEKIKRERPKLLLTEAWIRYLQHLLARIPMLLDRAESLLRSQTAEPVALAEIAFFRGYIAYFEGEAEQSLKYLENAVSTLAGTKSPILGETELVLGLARCMIGNKDLAVQALESRLGEIDSSEPYLLCRLIASLAFIHMLSGDLYRLQKEGQRLLGVSKKHKMGLAEVWGYYFLAFGYLHTGKLEAALPHFVQVDELRYAMEPRAAIDALAGLALTQQFLQREVEAEKSIQRLQEFARELNERSYFSLAQSCQARLSLLRGDVNSAVDWSRSVEEPPVTAELFSWFEAPSITQARVMIAENTKESLEKATDLLARIRQLSEACRFTCQIIEVGVLQSLASEKLGRSDEALAVLEKVVALAGPRGWVRPFVEAGPSMADLLERLKKQNVAVDYIEQLLAAFRNDEQVIVQEAAEQPVSSPRPPLRPSTSSQHLAEPLTNRELDILDLLAQRLQNKEIAGKLSISKVTVKSHLQNIYQKLNVKSRRQAVENAKALGILSRS